MVYTIQALKAQYQGPATELATAIWNEFPVLFPEFATDLVAGVSITELAHGIMYEVKDIPGAWGVHTLARKLAGHDS